MQELNDEYLRILNKSQEESISLVEQKDLDTEISVLNLAIERTNYDVSDYDFTVTQIGDYQIWRDRDELAIVDISEDRLVAFTQLSSIAKSRKSVDKHEDQLLNKVFQNYPNMVVRPDEDCLLKADRYFTELKEDQWDSKRILLHEEQEFSAKQIYLQEGVETAEFLAQYLERESLELKTSGFELSYNPQNQILTFEDKDGSSGSFSAQKIGESWYPLDNNDLNNYHQEVINHQEIIKRLERSIYQQQQQKNKFLSRKPKRLGY